MQQEFYDQGYDATSCGYGNSANCSQGSLMAELIKGYVDDTNNIHPNVGHRLSMLDPNASHTTFGAAGPTSPHTGRVYGVVNMFNLEETSNNDKYYAWSSAGNFPTEAIDCDAMWSFKGNGYLTTEPEVTITAGGKTYKSFVDFDLQMDQSWKTMYFHI